MARPKKGAAPKPRKFTEELLVKLDDFDLSEKRERLEEVAIKLQDLEVKRTAAIKTLNDEKTKLTIEHEQILKILRSKGEMKPVECVEEFDLDTNTAVTRRTDTDEQIRERALNGEERANLAQGELPVAEPPKNGAPAEA